MAASHHEYAGRIGGLTAWSNDRDQKLKDAEKGRKNFMSRFKNKSERKLYFQRLAQRSRKRRARKRPRFSLVFDPALVNQAVLPPGAKVTSALLEMGQLMSKKVLMQMLGIESYGGLPPHEPGSDQAQDHDAKDDGGGSIPADSGEHHREKGRARERHGQD